MTDRRTPAAGETFGAYTIESVVGRGGMGTVYLATHERLARRVALKVIAPGLADEEEFRERFLRESQLAASLDHPNVIPIYDADEIDGVLYLAMRYVSGPTLRALIGDRGSLSPQETSRVAGQVADALDAAHRAGLVHRDVKPANILLAEPDGNVYLCDFGLAKRTTSQAVTRTGSFLGTVDYCAPEQIQNGPVDGRTDVYALGCVLFHCLAAQPPYVRESEFAVLEAHLVDPPPRLSHLRPDLPRSLDGVISRALAKDPADRWPTAGGLAAALTEAVAPLTHPGTGDATRAAPGGSRPGARTDPPRGQARSRALFGRGRRLLAAASLVAVLGVGGALLLTGGSDGGSSDPDPAAERLRTFVDRIENVLEQSAAGRQEIGAALTAGLSCSISPEDAGRRIASVAENRQSILGQLGALSGPTQQADDIVTLLQRALQQSIEADRHYRDGLLDHAVGQAICPLPGNAKLDLAAADNARATAAKERLIAAFNPLARRFQRRVWTAGEI